MPNQAPFQYRLPSAKELDALDKYEVEFPRQVAFALRWIYDMHRWSGVDLERKIPGVKASVWQRYAQPAYSKARSLHVVAALSWVSQVSMSAILYGDRIAQYWSGVSREKIELFIFSGLMGESEFDYFVKKIFNYFPQAEVECRNEFSVYLKSVSSFDQSPHALLPLDIEAFGRDYYRSIALTLRAFRATHGLSVEDMALVLNLSDVRYRAIENVDHPPKALSLHLAARLKLAFHIPDTVPFLSQMSLFPGFGRAREIHQAREILLINILKYVPDRAFAPILGVSRQLVSLEHDFSRCAK